MTNEWYARDTSKKIRSAFQARNLAGKPTASSPTYGYLKSPENKDQWTFIYDTHEAIIDQDTYDNVQRMRANIRRYPDGWGEAHPLGGLMFCADCGSKMYVHRTSNGERHATFNCAGYTKQPVGTRCLFPHRVDADAVMELIRQTLKEIVQFSKEDETEFLRIVQEAVDSQQTTESVGQQNRLQACRSRMAELDKLMNRIYEDNALGKLPDRRYLMLEAQYTAEQEQLEKEFNSLQVEAETYEKTRNSAGKFVTLVKKYQNFEELTTPMLIEFIDRIVVHEREIKGCPNSPQKIEVYFNFVGQFCLPHEERPLTPEEISEAERREKLRRKRHEAYLRRKESGWQDRYYAKTKDKKLAKRHAANEAIRAEEMLSARKAADGSSARFTFIDLFAGIGGMRLAFENVGGRCVYSNEWNKYCQQTYFANFGEQPDGDITKVDARIIPNHDVLVAGFPCQPFSIAGVSKKQSLGRATGFEDKTQGILFFDVCRILKAKRPKAFMLENVKNLCSHDRGRTFKVILESLEELNYEVFYKVVDGQNYVPQHRERIVIVGFDRERYIGKIDFRFDITPVNPKPEFKDILESEVDDRYTLSDKLWTYLQDYAAKHKAAGNGFGYGIAPMDGVSRTLSARYFKDGSEILIEQPGKNPRRLTPRECARLQGFPDSFKIPVSDTQAYRQFGNSVVVPLMTDIAGLIISRIDEMEKGKLEVAS